MFFRFWVNLLIKTIYMKVYILSLIVGVTLLTACSKNDLEPVDSTSNSIDGFSFAQVDSIARHYGWTFTVGDTAKGKQTMKIQDFIKLAEDRTANGLNARTINIEGTLKTTNTVIGSYPDDGNTQLGLSGGGNAPLYNLTWKFPSFKSSAYPSLYNMTFVLYPPSGSSGTPQVAGADFMYDGADGPVASSDWSYNHQGSDISGTTSAFFVQNYGTEHEVIHIMGGTIQRHYLVQFRINGQSMATPTSKVGAIITLTLLN